MKNAILALLVATTTLAACSSEEPEIIQITEVLRKVNSPILGTWAVSGTNSCDGANTGATKIYMLENKVLAGNVEKQQPFMTNMKVFKSPQYIVLAGNYHAAEDGNERQLAFYDHGDQLLFAGYIVDNNLIDRKTILEKYNAGGNAAQSMSKMDFTFCNSDVLEEDESKVGS